jgi:hypothetical protein
MRAPLVAAAWVASLVISACAPAPSGEPPVRSADELRQAGTQVRAGEGSLTLEVEAWRSFQPIVGDSGDPLIAVLRLRAGEGGRVPGALAIEGAWLVRGNEVLRVEAREEEPRAASAEVLEFVVRDGPRWAAGDSIDVIVDVGGLDGPRTLLRAPRVVIARVD